MRHLMASPEQARATCSAVHATRTSASPAATCRTRSGSPRAAASLLIVPSLIEHAPSRRSPMDCLAPRLSSTLKRRLQTRRLRFQRAGTRRPRSSSHSVPSFVRERVARGAAGLCTPPPHVLVSTYGVLLKSTATATRTRFDRQFPQERGPNTLNRGGYIVCVKGTRCG